MKIYFTENPSRITKEIYERTFMLSLVTEQITNIEEFCIEMIETADI